MSERIIELLEDARRAHRTWGSGTDNAYVPPIIEAIRTLATEVDALSRSIESIVRGGAVPDPWPNGQPRSPTEELALAAEKLLARPLLHWTAGQQSAYPEGAVIYGGADIERLKAALEVFKKGNG